MTVWAQAAGLVGSSPGVKAGEALRAREERGRRVWAPTRGSSPGVTRSLGTRGTGQAGTWPAGRREAPSEESSPRGSCPLPPGSLLRGWPVPTFLRGTRNRDVCVKSPDVSRLASN